MIQMNRVRLLIDYHSLIRVHAYNFARTPTHDLRFRAPRMRPRTDRSQIDRDSVC
jgi:hypothetical protein